MNKFNIGDEVVYKLSGKIDNVMELAPGDVLYQLEVQNKDIWLEEKNLSFAEEVKGKGSVKKYRKKPVVIKAIQWDGSNLRDIQELALEKGSRKVIQNNEELIIPTLEGDHIASINDYIIQGINGEVYPCKPDIFKMTYKSTE